MLKNKQPLFAWLLLIVGMVACAPAPEMTEEIVTRPVVVQVTAVPIEVTRVVIEQEIVQVTIVPEAPPKVSPQSKDLAICMREEPESLFPITNRVTPSYVLQALYTNDFTNLSYGYQADGLEKLPSLADGDAVLHETVVGNGDMVLDAAGDVVTLAEGMSIVDANGETVVFEGEPVNMTQMAVDFVMKQRYWSDGTPVTAADSVYSFELTSNPDVNLDGLVTFLNDRTASYEATGDLSTRWLGLPGYLDGTYFTNFWQPLPAHAWQDYPADELHEVPEVIRHPIGDGAFMMDEWVEGEYMRLIPNPYYYRADEGLPYLDSVTFKYIPDRNQMMAKLIAGECDIATRLSVGLGDTPFLTEAEANGLLVPHIQVGTIFDHIDFGINSYGDYGDGIGRPDWFEDVRVRQAMTMCTDRQRMVDEILYGRSEVMHSYIPSTHPQYSEDLTEWPYDVQQGNALLDDVGFIDNDGDGWREDTESGVPFQVTLLAMTNNDMRRQAVEIFKENMVDCGIDVQLEYLPFRELFADGPEGDLFGRQFDLGEFSWLTGVDPSCNLFMSNAITGPPEEGFAGWGASNESGWSHAAFDAACQKAQSAFLGSAEYEEGHEEAQHIFAQELPIIPLFLHIKVATTRPHVLNFNVDPTENLELYNIYEYDLRLPSD